MCVFVCLCGVVCVCGVVWCGVCVCACVCGVCVFVCVFLRNTRPIFVKYNGKLKSLERSSFTNLGPKI